MREKWKSQIKRTIKPISFSLSLTLAFHMVSSIVSTNGDYILRNSNNGLFQTSKGWLQWNKRVKGKLSCRLYSQEEKQEICLYYKIYFIYFILIDFDENYNKIIINVFLITIANCTSKPIILNLNAFTVLAGADILLFFAAAISHKESFAFLTFEHHMIDGGRRRISYRPLNG